MYPIKNWTNENVWSQQNHFQMNRYKKLDKRHFIVLLTVFLLICFITLPQKPGESPCSVAARLHTFNANTLPKIVHQQWWPGKTVLGIHGEWHNQTKSVMIGYKHVLWGLEEMRALIANRYGWFLETYDAYPTDMHRADAARYFILYQFGGIYMDMDYVPLVDIYKFLNPKEPSFLESPFMYSERVGSALMSSPPNHPFWLLMFNTLQERRFVFNVVRATGPGCLSVAVDKWEQLDHTPVHVLSCENFFRIPLGTVGKHTNNLAGRAFRSIAGSTQLTKDCGTMQDECLYGIHYNTMLFM